MTPATRDQFLSAGKRRFKDVTLPISGLTVRIRSLSELEFSEFQQANYDKAGNRIKGRIVDARARLACLCVCDAAGNPIFLPGDEQELMQFDSADMAHLWEQIWAHIGAPPNIEETAKN